MSCLSAPTKRCRRATTSVQTMSQPINDRDEMIARMEPVLHESAWVFAVLGRGVASAVADDAFAIIAESEGMTYVLPSDVAQTVDPTGARYARITLNVWSDLDGVGLTAAVATALAAENIPTNVIAAYHHDHVFVPWPQRERAIQTLRSLSRTHQ